MLRYRSIGLGLAVTMAASLGLLAQSKPPATRQLRANGVDLSYIEQGKGAPVVFAHGAVGDLRFWEPQREAFAKQHRFIAYTYRYHGTAPWPDEGKQYSGETHAADLSAFIAGLKAGPVHLVGLSYGGLLAAMVALKDPQLIRSLTLAEPALFSLVAETPEGKPVLEAWGKSFAPVAAAIQAGDSVGAAKLLLALVNGEPVENFDKLPAGLRQILLDNARTLAPAFATPPGATATAASCDTLRPVKIPTLVIRGERTPEIFVKTNEAVARCIDGSRSIVIPKASHVMSYQNPAAFNAAVLEFVGKH